jgi:hypothetical protein
VTHENVQSKNTGAYKNGTLGEMNGMNHPSVEIPGDADAKWFLQYLS